MKTINSTELLTQLEAQVEQQLQLAISTFQNLHEDVLQKQSISGGWSIAQCFWHINSYGYYYLPAIEKSLIKTPNPSPLFTSSWLGAYFTKMMKPGVGMKKMKAFKSHTPPGLPSGASEVAEFIRQQEQLLKLIDRARQIDLNRARVAISISRWIKLRLGDVFQFFIMHQHRHIEQALKNVGR